MSRYKLWVASVALAVSFTISTVAQQPRIETREPSEPEVEAVETGESALRRFEIITLTALPFAAIHSFLIVKGVKVAKEGNFAASVDGSDWNYVGAGAAVFAVGIGVYDYLRMRGKDRNESLLPEPPPVTPFQTSSAFQPPLVAAAFRF